MLLKELNLGQHKYEFSSMAVSLSLEGKASHRELTSRLLSDLSGKMLSNSDMARAFDRMLKELPDLILDTPEAPQVGARRRETEERKMSCCGLSIGLCLNADWSLWCVCLCVCVQMLGQFIARAIADHVLPMSFLNHYKGKVDCDHARSVRAVGTS